ncbi:MAG: hypothetical protein P4M11_14435 [Candidatus Pacebacteria bacterium]|nr:hypothetical protein [Candidatus Paceibacterota bacterium]
MMNKARNINKSAANNNPTDEYSAGAFVSWAGSQRNQDLRHLLSTPPYAMSGRNRRYMLKMIYMEMPTIARRKLALKISAPRARRAKSPLGGSTFNQSSLLGYFSKRSDKENSPSKNRSFDSRSSARNSRNAGRRTQTVPNRSFIVRNRDMSQTHADDSFVCRSFLHKGHEMSGKGEKHYSSNPKVRSRSRQFAVKTSQTIRKSAENDRAHSRSGLRVHMENSTRLLQMVRLAILTSLHRERTP